MEPHFNCWANHDLAERLSPFRRDVLLERKRKTVVTVNKKNVIVRTSKYSETDNFICRGGQPLRGGTLEVVARGQRAGLAHLILSLNFLPWERDLAAGCVVARNRKKLHGHSRSRPPVASGDCKLTSGANVYATPALIIF